MGRLNYDKGKLSDALASFESAVKLAPNNAEGYAGRGVVGYALGDNLQRVRSDYLRAIAGQTINEDNAHLFANLGQVQWELGESQKAMQNLDAAIQIDPFNHEAVSVRILARIDQLGRTDREPIVRSCRDDLTRIFAESSAPTYWDYRALAAVNALLGDEARALRFQRLAVQEASRGPNKRFRESALATLSRYAEAKPDAEPRVSAGERD
jgi:tetratricopeptide (TPR) repeat protein